jgi:GH24 family phage-related lysozyme (muramidase)
VDRKLSAAGELFIKHKEKLHRVQRDGSIASYLCKNNVWTIGYGSTFFKGKPVTADTVITRAEAEAQFQADIQSACADVHRLIKKPLTDAQFSGLVSFIYNIGPTAFADSTLRRRINAGEDVMTVAKQELPRWVNDENGEVVPGLVSRRQAELALMVDATQSDTPTVSMDFRIADAARFDRGLDWQKDAWEWLIENAPERAWDQMQQALPDSVVAGFAIRFRNGLSKPSVIPPPNPIRPSRPNPLIGIPKFTQRDSQWIAQRDRKCYSSSNAMLVEYLKPGTLPGANGDDIYFAKLASFGGDTTEWPSQQRTLAAFGIKARLVQNADWSLVEQQIEAGKPVPLGYLHRGPVWGPRGGGHWCLCYGFDKTHFWISDPWGEPDLVSGATLSQGNWQGRVSRLNFGKRWMVELAPDGSYRYAPGKGWAVVVDSVS